MILTLILEAYAASEDPVASSIHVNGVTDMISQAGPMVKTVLLILLILSVACWAVILIKSRMLHRARRESAQFMELFGTGRVSPASTATARASTTAM